MKVFISNGFDKIGEWIDGFERTMNLEDADIVLFTGGADVSPSMYGEEEGMFTGPDERRDRSDLIIYEEAASKGKFMVGICRGAQFLTVMSGGKLVQHVNNHAVGKTHKIEDGHKNQFSITSTHHQMMFPFNLPKENYEIIAWASPTLSSCYRNGENNEIDLPEDFCEAEIVYYPKTKSFCIQGHPEYMEKGFLHDYLNFHIKKRIDIKIKNLTETLT